MRTRVAAARCLSLFIAACALHGCRGYMPRSEAPVIPSALSAEVPRGPSSQRVGRDGYPLVGAYPAAATRQVEGRTVAETQSRYRNIENRAQSDPRDYARSVSDLRDLTAEQRARAPSASAASVEELRAIAEERRRRGGTP